MQRLSQQHRLQALHSGRPALAHHAHELSPVPERHREHPRATVVVHLITTIHKLSVAQPPQVEGISGTEIIRLPSNLLENKHIFF